MTAQVLVTVWLEADLKATTFEEALTEARALKAEKFISTKSHSITDSNIQVIGVFDSEPLDKL